MYKLDQSVLQIPFLVCPFVHQDLCFVSETGESWVGAVLLERHNQRVKLDWMYIWQHPGTSNKLGRSMLSMLLWKCMIWVILPPTVIDSHMVEMRYWYCECINFDCIYVGGKYQVIIIINVFLLLIRTYILWSHNTSNNNILSVVKHIPRSPPRQGCTDYNQTVSDEEKSRPITVPLERLHLL